MNDEHLSVEKSTLLKSLGMEIKGGFLAGGALTATFSNRHIKDFDLYFKSKKDFEDAVHYAYDHSYWCVSISTRAITFVKGKDVYQLMSFRFFPSAEDIFESFDFTCCMAALDLDSERFVFHPRFFVDLSRRDLVFNPKTAYPLASGFRISKYQDRGYKIQKREWMKVIAAISFKKVESWDELKDQIGGQYGDQVAIDTTKPFNLENVIESLDQAHTESRVDSDVVAAAGPVETKSEMPGTPEEALEMIFKKKEN